MKNFKKLLMGLLILVSTSLSLPAHALDLKTVSKKIDDTAIVTVINAQYARAGDLSPFDVKVSSRSGNVTLKGTVDTENQFEKAVMIAASVDGVKSVKTNHLKIKYNYQPVTDLLITAKIKGKLLKHRLLNQQNGKYWSVNIKTKSGVVYLSTDENKSISSKNLDTLVNIAKSVKGVKSIRVNVPVK